MEFQRENTGFLIGCRNKIQISRVFREKFAEDTIQQEFSGKISNETIGNLQILQATACRKQQRHTHNLLQKENMVHLIPTIPKNDNRVVQLICTIVPAKKGILKAVCHLLTMKFFLTEIIIFSFNNNTLEKFTNGKAFYIVATAQFFTILI